LQNVLSGAQQVPSLKHFPMYYVCIDLDQAPSSVASTMLTFFNCPSLAERTDLCLEFKDLSKILIIIHLQRHGFGLKNQARQ
jgi:hypothetical protein